jgi:hypothetical protein
LADGIILDSSSKSEKRINESIFSKAQQRQIPPDHRRAARSVRGGYISLLSHVEAPVRSEISWRHRPNLSTPLPANP